MRHPYVLYSINNGYFYDIQTEEYKKTVSHYRKKAGQKFQIGAIFNTESKADLIKITVKNISKEPLNPPK